MGSKSLVPDLPPLVISGTTYDMTSILGREYDEFRHAKKKYCHTTEFRTQEALYKSKKKELAEVKKEYSAVLTEQFPIELISIRRFKDKKRIALSNMSRIEEEHRREHKQLTSSLHALQRRADQLTATSPRRGEVEDSIALVKQKIDLCDYSYRECIEPLKEEVQTCINWITELTEKKEVLRLEIESKIGRLEKDISNIEDRIEAGYSEILRPYYENAARAVALIQSDPYMGEQTCEEIAKTYAGGGKTGSGWDFVYEPESENDRATSLALISSAIKDNVGQSMAELIISVSELTQCSFVETMSVLTSLRKQNALFYFARNGDGSFSVVKWTGERKPALVF